LGYDLSGGSFSFEGALFHAEILPTDEFLPAGGQGVIALQLRSDDEEAKAIVDRINHLETLQCLRAERDFLRRLQGDCQSPVGVLATMETQEMTLCAQVFQEGEAMPKTGKVRSSLRTQEPEKISEALYCWMYGREN
jgi:porphobilinogen deaminase